MLNEIILTNNINFDIENYIDEAQYFFIIQSVVIST